MTNKHLFSALLLTLSVMGSPVQAREPDLQNGEDINELCAGCHGEFGQGGKEGEYPRLAGLSAQFLERQMHLFRDRKRKNMAMVEYVDERQAPDEDIQDIAAYLSQLRLMTKLPPIKEDEKFDPLERLLQAKMMLNIPRVDGDHRAGEKLYKRECRSCHGDKGEGRDDIGVPMLTGQYTNYLKRQVVKYNNGLRIHDVDSPEDRLLAEFTDEELHNIFAYLSILDDE